MVPDHARGGVNRQNKRMPASITIREITVRHCKLVQSFRGKYTGGEVDPDLDNFFVSISDGQATGYGECLPTSLLYSFSKIGRVFIDEWQTLLDICRKLPGQDARQLGHLIPDEIRCHDTNTIIDAVDFALHDLVGQRLGLPVAVLLGGLAKPFVWGMPVVHTDEPEKMTAKAERWHREYGFRYFKLKPTGEIKTDAMILQQIRARTSPEVRFYMDANYDLKMNPDEVIAYINELARYGLDTYEDPIDTDWQTYRYIKDRIRAKLMLDEKAHTPEAILEIIQNRCAHQINIHADWAGGFQAGIQKAQLAAMGGMSTMIGSTHYFGPGAAAYQILASVLPGDIPCEQVYMEVYGMHSLIPDPYEIRDGKIFIRHAPGLGVHPDLAAIEQITIKSERIS